MAFIELSVLTRMVRCGRFFYWKRGLVIKINSIMIKKVFYRLIKKPILEVVWVYIVFTKATEKPELELNPSEFISIRKTK